MSKCWSLSIDCDQGTQGACRSEGVSASAGHFLSTVTKAPPTWCDATTRNRCWSLSIDCDQGTIKGHPRHGLACVLVTFYRL